MDSAAFVCRLVSGAAVQINANGYNSHETGAKFGVTTVDFDLLYTVSGHYTYLINGSKQESPAGTLLLVAPGDVVSCVTAENSRQIYCHFQLLDREFHSLSFPVSAHRLEAGDTLGPLFAREYNRFRYAENPVPLESVLKLAAIEALQQTPMDITAFAGANRAVMPPQLMELLVYLNNNAGASITVADMARQMNMDESYFSRYFTKYLGVSPVKYLGRIRMEAARTLLFQSSRTVEEIAQHLGYANGFVLSKKFREYFGMSPTKYRKSVNGSEGSPVM